ncbi:MULTISPECIES: CBS domain-containing protein [Aestuariibaculum]|uniref:CBS domain-containing protein n=1 Tax=Aestuariibaculum lutulentum TaxID=2920935 RepID=A0ABS9RMT8_9FLAO|nr:MULTISPECIES: CBS domain-containing protein [Aestuariibaculum]MCH4553871.1 CBS domain-containing protein [Aestuariibaculum lutulentum]MCR8667580.1 CBS domain-containing protein [Aestuariibaculum sp. M13]
MKTNSIVLVMTRDVVTVSPHQKLLDVKHIYEKEKWHHHIPVLENDKLVGMVSLVDFMYNIAGAGLKDNHEVYKTLEVKDIMTAKPFYLTTSASVEDAAKVFSKAYYHAVPVLEDDKLVGIVSTADIINYYLKKAV